MSTTVHVKGISHETTEKEVKVSIVTIADATYSNVY